MLKGLNHLHNLKHHQEYVGFVLATLTIRMNAPNSKMTTLWRPLTHFPIELLTIPTIKVNMNSYNQGWRDNSNQRRNQPQQNQAYHNQPHHNQRTYQNPLYQPQHQNQPYQPQNQQRYQPPHLRPNTQNHQTFSQPTIEEALRPIYQEQKDFRDCQRRIETQLSTIIDLLTRLTTQTTTNNPNTSQPSSSSGIPSQPLSNPKGGLNAITLRSGANIEEITHRVTLDKEDGHKEDEVMVEDVVEEEEEECATTMAIMKKKKVYIPYMITESFRHVFTVDKYRHPIPSMIMKLATRAGVTPRLGDEIFNVMRNQGIIPYGNWEKQGGGGPTKKRKASSSKAEGPRAGLLVTMHNTQEGVN
ncbi:hypothetical protein PIB30_071902 [Stylosanthes scabra]|uniref:Uncharacterized protein n=1 Tax=Stylosanthes scabra TaxID=79078 RepID=A0ABU6QP03_9FABA|nr:hypothetical protein [Stylosanthes scabra]